MNTYKPAEKNWAHELLKKANACKKSNNLGLVCLDSRGGGKDPIKFNHKTGQTRSWVKNPFTHDEIKAHLNNGGRIAVIPMYLGFVILDFDLKKGQSVEQALLALQKKYKVTPRDIADIRKQGLTPDECKAQNIAPALVTWSRAPQERPLSEPKEKLESPQGFHLWLKPDDSSLWSEYKKGKLTLDGITVDVFHNHYVVLHHPSETLVKEIFYTGNAFRLWQPALASILSENPKASFTRKSAPKNKVKKAKVKQADKEVVKEEQKEKEDELIIDTTCVDKYPMPTPNQCGYLDVWSPGERFDRAGACYSLVRKIPLGEITHLKKLSKRERKHISMGSVALREITAHYLYLLTLQGKTEFNTDYNRVESQYRYNLNKLLDDRDYKQDKQEKPTPITTDEIKELLLQYVDLVCDVSFCNGRGFRFKSDKRKIFQKLFHNEGNENNLKMDETGFDCLWQKLSDKVGFFLPKSGVKAALIDMAQEDIGIDEEESFNPPVVETERFFKKINSFKEKLLKNWPPEKIYEFDELKEYISSIFGAPSDVNNHRPDYTFTALWRLFMDNFRIKFNPGALIRHSILIEGPVGSNKSSLGDTLARLTPSRGKAKFKKVADLGRGEFATIGRSSVVEFPEISIKDNEAGNFVKDFFSTRNDVVRNHHENAASMAPRCCVMIVTKNPGAILGKKFDVNGCPPEDILQKFMPIFVSPNYEGYEKFEKKFKPIIQSLLYFYFKEEKYCIEKWGEIEGKKVMAEMSAAPPGDEKSDYFYKLSGISRQLVKNGHKESINHLLKAGSDSGASDVIDKLEEILTSEKVKLSGRWANPLGYNSAMFYVITKQGKDGKRMLLIRPKMMGSLIKFAYSDIFDDNFSDLKPGKIRREMQVRFQWKKRKTRFTDRHLKSENTEVWVAPERVADKYFDGLEELEWNSNQAKIVPLLSSNKETKIVDDNSMAALEQEKQADDNAPMDSLEETLGF